MATAEVAGPEPEPGAEGEGSESQRDPETVVEVAGDEEEEGGEERGPRDNIRVRVLEYTKSSDDFSYTMEVVVNTGKPLLLQRSYESVKALYHLLSSSIDIGGHILPPLPAVPGPPQPHHDQLGSPPSSMFGGYGRLACLEMQSFLQSLADHPFFSTNHDVHTLLTSTTPHPSPDSAPGPSLWSSLTSAINNYHLGYVQDTDEEFVEMLRVLNERGPALEACAHDFNQLVTSWQKMACAEMTMGECVREVGEWEVGRNDTCARSLSSLSTIFSEYQKYNHSASVDAQNSVGFTFDLQYRYNKQAKDMLYRRLEKVQVLINASKQLDRAKPEKKEEAERVRAVAMTNYNAISQTARTEMEEGFSVMCVTSTRDSLVNLAESQLTQSRCILAQMTSLHSQLTIT